MITRKDKITGAALHLALKAGVAFDKVVRSPEHFKTKDGARIVVKRSRVASSPWRFSFDPSLVNFMNVTQKRADLFTGVYIWLVCGTDSICELRADEWKTVLHSQSPESKQWICISRPPDCSFGVRGSAGRLDHKVRVGRFPLLGSAA